MNTCDKCQWWDGDALPMTCADTEGMKSCNNEKVTASVLGSYDTPFDGIITNAKFGCIHWQLKRWIPTPEETARMAEGAE